MRTTTGTARQGQHWIKVVAKINCIARALSVQKVLRVLAKERWLKYQSTGSPNLEVAAVASLALCQNVDTVAMTDIQQSVKKLDASGLIDLIFKAVHEGVRPISEEEN